MENLENKINRLRSLKQYKNKTDEELEQIVLEKIRQEEIENVLLDFEDKHEKEYAKKLMDKYLSEYEFENSSEKDTLAHLIYCEVTIKRIKELMNIQKKESNGAVPQQLSVELRDYMNQVIDIKEKLGMNKKKEENSPLKTWMDLKEKALDWAKTHEAETTLKCPYCQNIVRVLANIENKIPHKMTFFKGTTVYNYDLFKAYHEKKLSKEEMAKILGVSVYYIEYIYDNDFLKELHDKENERKN